MLIDILMLLGLIWLCRRWISRWADELTDRYVRPRPTALVSGADLQRLSSSILECMSAESARRATLLQEAQRELEQAQWAAADFQSRLDAAQRRIAELEAETVGGTAAASNRALVTKVRSKVRQRLHPDRYPAGKKAAAERAFQECEAVFAELLP